MVLEHVQRNQRASPEQGLYRHEKFDAAPEFVSYRDLPECVAGYADALRDQGVGPGTRVLFPFESGTEVVLAFLGLMEVGALPLSVKPFAPNTPRQGYQEFLGRVARDFRATHVLRSPSLAGLDLPGAPVALPPAGTRATGARLRTPDDHELAFVQFSSGSTAFPKGIPVRQDRLRANLRMILRTDGRTAADRVSSWLPLYHDMGLVGGLLSCVTVGCDLLLAEPVTFLFDAVGWWAHMARERVSGSVIPNFAVDYSLKLLRELEPAEIAALDLSGIRCIYLGSEPINLGNLTAFGELMAPAGLARDVFMPCYGMAEAVLLVSSRPVRGGVRVVPSPAGVPAISVGRPMPEYAVRIRAEDGRACGEGELGEIELAGGSLADSYFDQPTPLAGADGFYATGDLGFLDDGELFVTGRISDRIKVNGQSLFAADFEQALARLPFVREGRTVVAQTGARILVLTEVERAARADVAASRARIVEHLATAVGVTVRPDDVHFLRPGQLPRTSSGKLQRRAVVAAYERGELKAFTLGAAPQPPAPAQPPAPSAAPEIARRSPDSRSTAAHRKGSRH